MSAAERTGRVVSLRRPGVMALTAAAVASLTFSVFVGLTALSIDLPGLVRSLPSGDWGIDGRRHLAAAVAVVAGDDPYLIEGFLYSPLAAWAMVPLAALGTPAGLLVFLILKLGLLVWFLSDATRPWSPLARALAGILVLTWVFLLDDLWMGNVSILIVCAMWLSISRDRASAGIPLGMVVATVAKPLLIPFLLWMFVYRRRSLGGVLMAAGAATAVTITLIGVTPYLAYLKALTNANRFIVAFPGNLGLSASMPQLLLPLSVTVLALYLALLWRSRDESALLLWSLLVGLIAAPYVPLYGPVPLIAGVFPFVQAHPVRALGLAAIVVPMLYFNVVTAILVAMVLTFPRDTLASTSGALRGAVSKASDLLDHMAHRTTRT